MVWGSKVSSKVFWAIGGVFFIVFAIFFATRLTADDSTVKADDSEITAVKQAAQDALKVFLPRAEIQKQAYGFEPADVVDTASLKSPVELFVLDDKSVLAFHSGQPVTSLLKPTGQWLVPVAISGTNRAMIEVTQAADRKWTGSGWGLSPLSHKWQNIKTWWPDSGKFTPMLIISPPTQGYFFTVPQVEPANLTALSRVSADLTGTNADAPPPLESADQSVGEIQKTLKQLQPEAKP